MFQSLVEGRRVPWALLVKDVPPEHHQDLDYLVELLDWDANVDPEFRDKTTACSLEPVKPLPRSKTPAIGAMDRLRHRAAYLAKELTVLPGARCTIKDAGAYGIILTQGHGKFGKLPVSTPALIRFGEIDRGRAVRHAQTPRGPACASRTAAPREPLVILKHFGPAIRNARTAPQEQKVGHDSMSTTSTHNYPALHNADVARPGRQGQPGRRAVHRSRHDARPDRRAPRSTACKFDGVDLFLFDPHVSIDCHRRRPQAAGRQDRGRKASSSARSSRRCGRRPAAARRWAATRSGSNFVDAGAQGLPHRQEAARAGRSPVRRRAHRLGVRVRAIGRRIRRATRRRSPRRSARPATSPRITASGSRPKARSAGAACTAGSAWSSCSNWSTGPRRVGFQADMAHTLLYTLGYNAPEDRILPEDFDWTDPDELDAALQEADRRAAALDDRFPRRAERRAPSKARARTTRPAATAWRTIRTASSTSSASRRLLAARRERQVDQDSSSTSAGTAACSRTRR